MGGDRSTPLRLLTRKLFTTPRTPKRIRYGSLNPSSAPILSLGNIVPTSGKSTQKAFIFNPYRKLAKLSLNLDRLSCISCRCMKFASRSAIESESSANAGSRICSGKDDEPSVLPWPWLSRRDVREPGRRGVVGREEGAGRELDLFTEVPSILEECSSSPATRHSDSSAMLESRGMFTIVHEPRTGLTWGNLASVGKPPGHGVDPTPLILRASKKLVEVENVMTYTPNIYLTPSASHRSCICMLLFCPSIQSQLEIHVLAPPRPPYTFTL